MSCGFCGPCTHRNVAAVVGVLWLSWLTLRVLKALAQGRSQGGGHRGHLPPPPFFPESCNIYHFLPYKYQHQVVTAVFRVKNHHRKADYKAICKQTFELCLDRAVSGLESRTFDEFKGHKTERVI